MLLISSIWYSAWGSRGVKNNVTRTSDQCRSVVTCRKGSCWPGAASPDTGVEGGGGGSCHGEGGREARVGVNTGVSGTCVMLPVCRVVSYN